MIKIDLPNKIPAGLNTDKDRLRTLVSDALTQLGISNDLLIEINFSNEIEIRKLNLAYRGIDKPTDVLSFPVSQVGSTKIELLGSIVISAKMVMAKEENINNVVKHGLLHLLGFDHESNKEEWDKAAKKIRCGL